MIRRKGIPPRCRSFDKKSDAVRWARELEAEADSFGALQDMRLAASMTLGDVLRRYRAEVSPTKRSCRSEQIRINGILHRDICHRTLATLGGSDVAKYRDTRLKSVGPATVIRELGLLSHALDIAQKEWGICLRQNPFKLVRLPRPPRGRDRRLETAEEARLLQSADVSRCWYLRPMIILAVETGMRRGEILSLLWEHIDLDRRVAHLPLTKNGGSRDIPLSTRAAATLVKLGTSDCGPVFDVTAHACDQAWRRTRLRAGLANLRFHDLRHEGISRLFEKGFNVVEAAAVSGHADPRALARYTHPRAAEMVARLG
jgi:integrase